MAIMETVLVSAYALSCLRIVLWKARSCYFEPFLFCENERIIINEGKESDSKKKRK